MVKSLHPIEEIAARIASADGDGVRLTRGSSAASEFSQPVEPAAAAAAALAAPLDFPPLSAGIVPGDRIAIAIDDTVPCAGAVARGVVDALQLAGVDPHDIAIVTSDAQTDRLCREAISQAGGEPQFIVHDPADEANLCFIGATGRGRPVVINRTIFEADVVLLVRCAQVNRQSAFEGLFPRFSSTEILLKYRTPSVRDDAEAHKRRIKRSDAVGRMVGVLITVQVVPGSGDTVIGVLAGEPQAVARQSRKLCRGRWRLHSPQPVSLVIATIAGGTHSQSWANVGSALATAEHLLEEGGAVAICSNLDEPPGKSLGLLIGSDDLAATERKIFRNQGADSWPAWQLARALQRGPIYFLSKLSTEMVEDLGLAPVESIDELVRLASRHESFVVVEDAQRAVVTVSEEDEL